MPRYVKSKTSEIVSSGYTFYERPSDWLELPEVSVGEQVVYILVAVWEHESNFAAVLCRGAYIVNWGDGVVESYADNVQAEHYYDYSSISSATWCESRGCRQVIIEIRPQSGSNLTRVEFARKHSQAGLSSSYSQPWLDVRMAGQYVNYISFYADSMPMCRHLEMFEFIGPNQITSLANVFRECRSLKRIVRFDTSNVTNMSGVFYNCSALVDFPSFDFSKVTSLGNSFYNCHSLSVVPDLNLPACTNMSWCFCSCYSLYSVGVINAPNCTYAIYLFWSCYSLRRVEGLILKSGCSVNSIFRDCNALSHFPGFGSSVDGDISYAFSSCYFIQIVKFSGFSSTPSSLISPFLSCYSLSWLEVPGIAVSFSVSGGRLSREALVRIFNDLGVVSGKTLTITGNWGVAYLTDEDKAIATGKGWTLVT